MDSTHRRTGAPASIRKIPLARLHDYERIDHYIEPVVAFLERLKQEGLTPENEAIAKRLWLAVVPAKHPRSRELRKACEVAKDAVCTYSSDPSTFSEETALERLGNVLNQDLRRLKGKLLGWMEEQESNVGERALVTWVLAHVDYSPGDNILERLEKAKGRVAKAYHKER